ncbi:MAG: IS3 family transposase, partial [Collinsella sp.]|nr:IS3 family transposase [Collinsella sp.]
HRQAEEERPLPPGARASRRRGLPPRRAFVSPIKGDLEKYIDWYNNVRIKRRLNGCGPVEYRLGRAA